MPLGVRVLARPPSSDSAWEERQVFPWLLPSQAPEEERPWQQEPYPFPSSCPRLSLPPQLAPWPRPLRPLLSQPFPASPAVVEEAAVAAEVAVAEEAAVEAEARRHSSGT